MPDLTGRGTNFVGPIGAGSGAYRSLIAAETLVNVGGGVPSNGMTYGLNLVGGFTITLPSIADCGAGWRATFRVEIAPTTAYIITEDTGEDTDIMTGGINELEVDTMDDGPYSAAFTQVNYVANVAVVGDYFDIECNGTRFYIRGQTNADGGITLT